MLAYLSTIPKINLKMSYEDARSRVDQSAEHIQQDFDQRTAEHEAKLRAADNERRRESRRTKTLEGLQQNWESILAKDNSLVDATDKLFGDPTDAKVAKHFQDGESRPGKGEAEVERVYADSSFIPISESDDGLTTFGGIRLWGIFRSGDSGGGEIDTHLLRFGERAKRRDLFDVFYFDSYDIFYALGTTDKPRGFVGEPIGSDLRGRNIYGQLIMKGEDVEEDELDSVDDVVRFSTTYSIRKIWIKYSLDELHGGSISDDDRKDTLKYIRQTIKSTSASLENYEKALDELLLAEARAKMRR